MPFFTVSSSFVTEANSGFPDVVFTITLDAALPNASSVRYRTLPRYANGADGEYFEESGVINFAAGQTSATIVVDVTGDTFDEVDEAFIFQLFNPTGGATFENGAVVEEAFGFVRDDDGAGNNLGVFVSNATIVEGDSGVSQAVFTVELSRPNGAALNFNYTTIAGSALAGSDFVAESGVVTIGAGQTSAEIIIDIVGNSVAELAESFFLAVTPTGSVANGAEGAVGEGRILDNDVSGGALPVISVSPGALREGASGFPDLEFVLTLSAPSANTVTVSFRTLNGTAGGDSVDFFDERSTVTFAPGQTSASVIVDLTGEVLDETDESISFELFNPVGAVLDGEGPVLRTIGIIGDDDGAGSNLGLFVSDPVIVEGDSGARSAIFEVTISRPQNSSLTLAYQTTNGTAIAGQDYTAQSGSLVFAPGQTKAYVQVPVITDSLSEISESFNLVVTPTGVIANGATDAVGVATLLDDDASAGALPVVSVFQSNVIESATSFPDLEFTVVLSAPSSNVVTVAFRTLNGTAQGENVDFFEEASIVTFQPGQTSQTIIVQADTDTIDEADESIILELFNPTAATLANDAVVLIATGVILDDDGTAGNAANLALFVSDAVIVEETGGANSAVFEVRLSRPSDVQQSFSFQTVAGSATAGADFTAQSGTVVFAPGQQVAFVSVPIVTDALVEASENFSLIVTPTSAIRNGVEGAGGIATIVDDDAAVSTLPVISVVSGRQAESGTSFGDIEFTVYLSAPSANAVTVFFRTLNGTASGDGVDFFEEASFITFAPGQTSRSILVQANSDVANEFDESVVVELFNPTAAVFSGGATSLQVFGIIEDDDGLDSNLSLFVGSPVIVEGNGGALLAAFEVRLSEPAPTALALNYSTQDGTARAGLDYTATAGSVAFLPGQETATVYVPVTSDLAREAPEQFSLVVTPTSVIANGVAGAVGVATINDDDSLAPGLPTISIRPADGVEGPNSSAPVEFVVSLSAPSTNQVRVSFTTQNGSATGGVDFQAATGTLFFDPGETQLSVNVLALGDTAVELDEDFFLVLSNPLNAELAGGASTLAARGIILDDDNLNAANSLALFVSNVTESEDQAADGAFVDVVLSRPTSTALTFTYSTVNGTAVAGQDFTAVTNGTFTIAPGQTRALIPVSVIDDGAPESTESFTITIAPTGIVANGGAGFSAIVTLTDGADNASGLDDDIISGGSSVAQRTFNNGLDIINPGAAAASDRLAGAGGRDLIGGGNGNDIIDGGAGDDALFGEAGIDSLLGGDGNDIVLGGAGGDDLFGGAGFDLASYGTAASGVTVNLASPAANTGDAAGDTVRGDIEGIIGSNFADFLQGNSGANELRGGAGNDTLLGGFGDDVLTGGAGADSINGGDGFDTATYRDAIGLVRVALWNPATNTGDAAGDIINFQVEVVEGSSFNDNLQGNSSDNNLRGGAGNDLILGGFGNDTLIGGAGADDFGGGDGFDTVSYATALTAVRVALFNPSLHTGDAAGDNIRADIEVVQGSAFNDSLEGSASDNNLRGAGGNDAILGGFGNDTLWGQAGNDTLTGGSGNDRFVFEAGGGADRIQDLAAGAGAGDVINLTGFGAAFDTFGEVVAAASQTGANVVIAFGGGASLTLANLTIAALNADDFVFG